MSVSRFLRNLSLGIKLNAVVVLTFGILLVAILLVTSRSVGNLTIQTGRQRIEQEVEVMRSRFDEAVQEVLVAAKLVAAKPGLIGGVANRDVMAVQTITLTGIAPLDLDDVGVFDADGVSLLEEEGDTPLPRESEEALVSLSLIGIETTGPLIAEKEEGQEFRLAASIPLRDTLGTIIGALIVSRAVDNEFLAETNFSRKDVHLALIHDGRILADAFPTPGELEESSGALLEETAIGQALSGQTLIADNLVYNIGGIPHTLAYVPLTVGGDTQAVIAIQTELGELFAFQRQLITNMAIVFALLTLLAVVAVTLFTYKSVAAPIGKLGSVAGQIARGDYSQRAEVTTRDEVGQLARVFNEMTSTVQRREEELQQALAEREEKAVALQQALDEVQRGQEKQVLLLDTIRQMSTPVVPVHRRVLVMPLVGIIDQTRSQQIMETLLHAIGYHGAEVVIIDITGVAVVDTRVAHHLIQVARAARLLGTQCVLVGIAPEVAQAIVSLGVDLSAMATRSDLQSGIEYALGQLKQKIVPLA